MRRIILATFVLAVLAAAGGVTWFVLHRSGPARTLARAKVALRAEQAEKALRLAGQYIQDAPDDWQGYLVSGLAHLQMGNYSQARQALKRAVELNPAEVSATIALAKTYMLPALRALDDTGRMPDVPELQAKLQELQRANDILRAAKAGDPAGALALRQLAASNTMCMARICRKITKRLADDLAAAQAGHATERLEEIHKQYEAAVEKARSLASRAIEELRQAIVEAKELLARTGDKPGRTLLEKHTDMAARDLVQLCADFDYAEHRRDVNEAVTGLEEISPVAVALATMNNIRHSRFHSAKERREAILQACQRLDRLEEIACERQDDRREILLSRASLALALEDHDTVERACREVMKDLPDQPTARLLLAETMMARGQFAEAETALFVLRTEMPRSSDIAFAYGRAAEAAGKAELARSAMQAVVELNPRHAAARKHLIEKYLRDGYLDHAYAQAHGYYLNCKEDPNALRLLANAAMATDRAATAETAAKRAVEQFADHPQMLLAAAEVFALLGDQARSLEAAGKAARAKPDDTFSRLAVARAMVMTGRTEEAEAILECELAQNRAMAAAQFEMAGLYAATGRLMQAVDRYQAAIDAEPADATYPLAMAESLLKMGSLRRCSEALKTLPADDPKAGLLRLQLRALQGKPASAADMIALSGGGKQSLLPAAMAFLNWGAPAQCLELCRRKLESSGADVAWRVLAGEACLAMGRLDECQEHWRAALATAPDRLDVYLRLARLLARREPCNQVCKQLAAFPGARDELATLAAAALLSEIGEHGEAAKLCSSLLERKDAPDTTRNSARLLLARSLALTGETPKALAELDSLAQDKTWAAEALMAKARMLVEIEEYKEALAALAGLRAEGRRRGQPELIEQVIELYSTSGETDMALACCDDILAMPVGARRGNLAKAWIHLANEKPDLAEACYKKAIDASPNDLSARRGLVEALDALCRPAEALKALQEMESLGPAGGTEAALMRAGLLTKWGLRAQAIECLGALDELGHADNPGIQLAAGRAFADIGEAEKARDNLRRVPRHAREHIDAQIALAGLAPSAAETLRILEKISATYPGNDKVLEQAMLALLQGRSATKAVAEFRAFVETHCRDRSWPEAAALLALQALLESHDDEGAWQLASRVASQNGKLRWRRLSNLLSPRPKAPNAITLRPTETVDLLIAIVNASRFADAETLRIRSAELGRICSSSPDACRPDYRILAALTAHGSHDPEATARALANGELTSAPLEALAPDPASDRARQILNSLPPCQLPSTLRASALAMLARADGDTRCKQATELLRACLTMEMGFNVLAHRTAMDVLSADKTCQWAAVVAVAACSDSQAVRQVLATLRPADCATAIAIQAELLLKEGKHEQAAQAFQQAGSLIGNSFDLRLKQAIALETAGRLDEALNLYRQVHSSARGEVAAIAANNAAYIVGQLWPADNRRLLEAYGWSVEAVKTCPNAPAFHDTRGWIAHLLGRKDEACLELRKALPGMSDSAEVHAHLAEAEAAAGNNDLAQWHRQAAESLRRKDKPKPAQSAETGHVRLPGEVR